MPIRGAVANFKFSPKQYLLSETKGREKMQDKTKIILTTIATLAMFSLLLVSTATAAGSVTLNPTAQAPGGSVVVTGSSFAASRSVGICFGSEVAGSDSAMAYSEVGGSGASGGLNWTGRLSHYPIKPGSYVFTSDTGTGGIVSTYTDLGDGTCSWSYDGSIMGRINYTSGVWIRATTVDVTGIAALYSATYTRYQYNLTSAASITTNSAGGFSATITVPTVANGNYNVTVIDSAGNRVVVPLTVNNAIPEVLPPETIMLLSVLAVAAGVWFLRKRPTIKTNVA
jgi:hypothetical protein